MMVRVQFCDQAWSSIFYIDNEFSASGSDTTDKDVDRRNNFFASLALSFRLQV